MNPVNRIGPFVFIGLAGQIALPSSQVEVRGRDGQDGKWFSLTGRKAKTTTLRSEVDAFHLADGHLALSNYRTLIGDEPQEVVLHGVNYTQTYNVKFIVIDIDEASVAPMVGMIGGFYFPSRAFVMATWKLEAVEV